jgi:hypothetical protein
VFFSAFSAAGFEGFLGALSFVSLDRSVSPPVALTDDHNFRDLAFKL